MKHTPKAKVKKPKAKHKRRTRPKKRKFKQKKYKPGPRVGSPEFAELQAKWYGKLKADGFQDLEWIDHDTGRGQNSDYLANNFDKRSLRHAPETETFYRLVRNFVTHHAFDLPLHERMMDMYADGVSYRDILKRINKWAKKPKSLFYVWYHINAYKKQVMSWNKTSPDGLLYEPTAAASLLN